MTSRPFGERHPDIIDHFAWQLSCRPAHQHEMLIIVSIFASSEPGLKESQMPGRAHTPMPKHASEKTKIPRDKIPGMDRIGWEIPDGIDQLFIHNFICIKVQLPITRDRQVVNRPIALCAIMFEGMLNYDRSA